MWGGRGDVGGELVERELYLLSMLVLHMEASGLTVKMVT